MKETYNISKSKLVRLSIESHKALEKMAIRKGIPMSKVLNQIIKDANTPQHPH